MHPAFMVLIILGALALLAALVSYVCFRMAFYAKREPLTDEYKLPDGDIYLPHKEQMLSWMRQTREMPCKEVSITSFDGLTLWGKYYEYAPGAVTELMFHGYRGTAERDLCGGVQRCFKLGHNAFIVDQRTSGKSGGNVITFGVNESKDCLSWLAFLREFLGEDTKIILCGISMGASTVMMASGKELPPNVIGVLADCGFSSAKEIIKKVIKQRGLPAKPLYPFVRLGARLYGGFNLEEDPPEQALKSCKVPLIIFHGESDDYVPCYMSRICYDVCPSRKRLVTVPNAGHGLSYILAPDQYINELKQFFN